MNAGDRWSLMATPLTVAPLDIIMDPENLQPATVPDASISAGEPQSPVVVERSAAIAHPLHTAILIIVLLAFSYFGSGGQEKATAKHGKTALYVTTIAFEWIVVGYVILGTRRRGVGLGNLIGGNAAVDRLFTRGLPEWSEMKP